MIASKSGGPNPQSADLYSSAAPLQNRATQQEVSGGPVSKASSDAPHRSQYRLNQPPQPPVCGKLFSTKPVPGVKKVGDRWPKLLI